MLFFIAAKFIDAGAGNDRLSRLFSYVPELRRLGLLHYQMTTTQTLTAEEVENEQVGET